MAKIHGIAAAVGALALASVAVSAHAEGKTQSAPQAFTVDPSVWQPNTSRTMQWNGKGRWGLNLDVEQPTTREMNGGDVTVGPTYKVTKHVQIRGGVNLGDGAMPRVITSDAKPQPRVRLETLFRF